MMIEPTRLSAVPEVVEASAFEEFFPPSTTGCSRRSTS